MRRDMKRYRLPEPVVVPADGPGPAEHAELADSLSMPFLVLLEALSPAERAVFTLREVFGDLALEHGHLMAQDQDLRVLSTVGPGEQDEPAEDAKHRHIGKWSWHGY